MSILEFPMFLNFFQPELILVKYKNISHLAELESIYRIIPLRKWLKTQRVTSETHSAYWISSLYNKEQLDF